MFKRRFPISFLFALSMLQLVSCNGQNKSMTVQKSEPTAERMQIPKVTEMSALALTSIMDVENISKYSSSCGQENYKEKDEYYNITFQDKGQPYFFVHAMLDGTIIYMQKLFPVGKTKSSLTTSKDANKIGSDFLLQKLNVGKDKYILTKTEQEKAGKGIDAYWILTFDKNPSFKNPKVPNSLVLKIHPKTEEIMVIEYKYPISN